MHMLDALRQDIRYALRALRKAPAVTALVVISLALAIAGNTTVFSLVNGILYRPMPYHQPERIALVGEYQDPKLADQINGTSIANFLDWEERQDIFAEMAVYNPNAGNLGPADSAEPVTVGLVTPDFFPLLGTEALVGRTFVPEEGRPGEGGVVVLGHGLWQSRFGADPDILGRTITLDDREVTVVGVLPERFEFIDPTIQLWRPLSIDPAERPDRGRRNILALGRLAPGVTTDEANAAMQTVAERLAAEYPEANRGYQTRVLNLRENVPSSQDRQLLVLLQGALVFVLLIACANIANLLLARTQGRITELAVRSSLGAGRWRIARQLGVEALVAATLGGLLGLGGGVLGTRLMADAFAAQIPRFWLPTIDVNVVLFTAGVTVFAGLLVGILPALHTARLDIQSALKEGGRGSSLGGRRKLVTKGLVVAEIALALVLLGGGSVLIESFLEVQKRDPGFDTSNLVTLRVSLPEERYDTPAERSGAFREIAERLAALPGVDGAAASSDRPRTPLMAAEQLTVDGAPPLEGQAAPTAAVMVASPGFFDTVGIDLLQGRPLQETDGQEAARVALVNQSFAERHWPGGDPLGRRVTVRGEPRRVVGVTEDVIHGVFFERDAQPAIYLPIAQEAPPSAALTLAVRTDPASFANPVRDALGAIDPGLVPSQVQPLDEFTQQFFVGMQVLTVILGGFGLLALLLAALGTYGVLAYSVAQRTHEIGVRMALGAGGGDVKTMIARQGLILAGIGIALGIPGVILVTRVIGSMISNMTDVEPRAVLLVAGVLAVVTLLASWMPARRAAGVDPLVALRGE